MLTIVLAAATVAASPTSPARICGWWVNPSPQNVEMITADREYEVSRQGDFDAEGRGPDFPASRWIHPGGPGDYGYGCACITATVDDDRVTRIASARSLPLASCRRTPGMRRVERRLK